MPRHGSDGTQNSQYVNLRPGINLGPWRYRNYSTWNHNDDGQKSWDSVYNYVSRDIKSLKSQLILGDSVSPSDVFDSIAFRGGQAASDDDMLPDSQKGFAPVIRGIARSNAEVTVEQNGYTIYRTTVPPGAFEINDMYPTGGSGDMQLTIKESDGSEQHLTIPYASLPVLQREGRLKYSLTGGRTRSNDSSDQKMNFGQMTAIYGMPWGVTLYGGTQLAESKYNSVALDSGVNLGDIGALSMDVTQAWSKIHSPDNSSIERQNGQSLRVRYSKNIIKTGTNFSVAGYRYSTGGYYTLQDMLNTYNDNADNDNAGRRRNRTDISLSQDVVFGTMSLSLINENYWDRGRMSSVSIGYNNNWKSISYGFNYTYSKNSDNSNRSNYDDSGHGKSTDQIFSFNVSVPLDKWLSGSSANYSLNSAKHGPTSHNIGLNGTALQDNNLNWSVQQGYVTEGNANTGNANATYQGTYAKLNAGYGYDDYADRFNYGVQGGVVVHGDGVTLSQPLSDTIVLVKAPGAEGVPVNNQTGVKTDFRGYAVVPYASPYRKSDITLNTEEIPDNNLELDDTSKSVVPTRGAVVRAEYITQTGYRALMTLEYAGGMIPFGAIVSQASDTEASAKSSIVGDDGQVYVAGLQNEGQLLVTWGKSAGEQCMVNYRISPQETSSGVLILREKCL
ncbi:MULTISPECIES: fimbria/pilus outer membrane usher protein [Limnobaculum]|uniref:fimbria/pilus outer membrane usher protein n=1 Tax=Limnobaculum TaxID=2172100 RepID=UPI001E2D99DF|nr:MULTISPECIES: fimbria/pilus outer membrane usher protein [Limnobaculum]